MNPEQQLAGYRAPAPAPVTGRRSGRPPPGPARGRHHRRRAGGHRARRGPGPGRPPGRGRVRGVRRLAAPGARELPRRGDHRTQPGPPPRRPGPADRARRRAARPGRRARGDRGAAGGPDAGPRQRAVRRVRARARRAPGRAPAGPAPGDDVHRPRRRRGPAARHLLRGDRARGAQARGRGAGDRDGRRAGLHRRGAQGPVPRGHRGRREPPDHARRPGHGPAQDGRGGRARPAARAAALRVPGQRAAVRRRGPDRPGRPR